MNQRLTYIDGKICKRISRRTAQKLSETTDKPVYCYPVLASPASPFVVGLLMNNISQTKESFYSRMFEFMYYNSAPQLGYYAAFYTPLEVTDK